MRDQNPSPDTRILRVFMAATALWMLAACGPVLERVVETDKVAVMEGNVVAVGSPALLGSQPGHRGVVMQGSYEETRLRGRSPGNRQSGVPGHSVLRKQLRGVMGVGVSRKTTVGFTGRWATHFDREALSTDAPDEVDRDVWGIGFASRSVFAGDGPIDFELAIGLEALFLPYEGQISGRYTESFFDPDYCEDPNDTFAEPHFEGIIEPGQPCADPEEALVLRRRGRLEPKFTSGVRLAFVPRVDMGLTGHWGVFRPFIWGGLVGQPVIDGLQFVSNTESDTDEEVEPIPTREFGNLDLDLVRYVGMGTLTIGAEFAFLDFMSIILSGYFTQPLVQFDGDVDLNSGLGTMGASFTMRFTVPGDPRPSKPTIVLPGER